MKLLLISNSTNAGEAYLQYPIKQIAIKADYSYRFLKSQYNNEPSLNIGIAYEAFFL